ncbi:MAG TPA: hypothetical protein VEO00_04100 [Actinomycetota bacterium]|nr:hypothetical protein [Actinomycetota bacterium]
MRVRFGAALALAALTLAACGGAGGNAGEGGIEFREIGSGGVPGQERLTPEALVLRSVAEARDRLEGRVDAQDLESVASLDFGDRALVAVFAGMGNSPAVEAHVKAVRVRDRALEIEVNVRQQGGPAIEALVGLYVLVDVAAADVEGIERGTVEVKTVKGPPVVGQTPNDGY